MNQRYSMKPRAEKCSSADSSSGLTSFFSRTARNLTFKCLARCLGGNSKELEITLYENYDKKLKRLVLEFIAENDIVCHLGLRQGLNSISFRKAKLIKLKEIDKYVLISV